MVLKKKSGLDWFSSAATILSLLACYGTLALIAILGTLGIVIVLNEALWAGSIITFAVLAVGSLGISLARHRKPWPILPGGLGLGLLIFTMYLQYNRLTELAGFSLLILATLWDWWIRRRTANT